jgi:hypothetical protein
MELSASSQTQSRVTQIAPYFLFRRPSFSPFMTRAHAPFRKARSAEAESLPFFNRTGRKKSYFRRRFQDSRFKIQDSGFKLATNK